MSEIALPENQLYLENTCNLYGAGEFDETYFRGCYFSVSGFSVDKARSTCWLSGSSQIEHELWQFSPGIYHNVWNS